MRTLKQVVKPGSACFTSAVNSCFVVIIFNVEKIFQNFPTLVVTILDFEVNLKL